MSANQRNKLEQKIDEMEFTLYDRLLYGGLGHGYFCLPTNLIRIIATVLFPPIAIILKHLKLSTEFPYITMESLVYLLKNVDDIIYSFTLTALFYIPGLIYGLSNIKCAELGEDNPELKELTEADIKQHFQDIKTMNRIKRGNNQN